MGGGGLISGSTCRERVPHRYKLVVADAPSGPECLLAVWIWPLAKLRGYKNAKEWLLYIKSETSLTIWTNTKSLTGKIVLCTIFVELMRLFGNACIANF